MPETRKADPRAKRTAAWVFGGAVVTGGLLIQLAEWSRPMVRDWLVRNPPATPSRLRMGSSIFVAILFAPLVGVAAYLWRLGDRIVQTQRFPAPGMAVIRDRRVLTGSAAQRRGRTLQIVAALLVGAALALLLLLWRLALLLEHVA